MAQPTTSTTPTNNITNPYLTPAILNPATDPQLLLPELLTLRARCTRLQNERDRFKDALWTLRASFSALQTHAEGLELENAELRDGSTMGAGVSPPSSTPASTAPGVVGEDVWRFSGFTVQQTLDGSSAFGSSVSSMQQQDILLEAQSIVHDHQAAIGPLSVTPASALVGPSAWTLLQLENHRGSETSTPIPDPNNGQDSVQAEEAPPSSQRKERPQPQRRTSALPSIASSAGGSHTAGPSPSPIRQTLTPVVLEKGKAKQSLHDGRDHYRARPPPANWQAKSSSSAKRSIDDANGGSGSSTARPPRAKKSRSSRTAAARDAAEPSSHVGSEALPANADGVNAGPAGEQNGGVEKQATSISKAPKRPRTKGASKKRDSTSGIRSMISLPEGTKSNLRAQFDSMMGPLETRTATPSEPGVEGAVLEPSGSGSGSGEEQQVEQVQEHEAAGELEGTVTPEETIPAQSQVEEGKHEENMDVDGDAPLEAEAEAEEITGSASETIVQDELLDTLTLPEPESQSLDETSPFTPDLEDEYEDEYEEDMLPFVIQEPEQLLLNETAPPPPAPTSPPPPAPALVPTPTQAPASTSINYTPIFPPKSATTKSTKSTPTPTPTRTSQRTSRSSTAKNTPTQDSLIVEHRSLRHKTHWDQSTGRRIQVGPPRGKPRESGSAGGGGGREERLVISISPRRVRGAIGAGAAGARK